MAEFDFIPPPHIYSLHTMYSGHSFSSNRVTLILSTSTSYWSKPISIETFLISAGQAIRWFKSFSQERAKKSSRLIRRLIHQLWPHLEQSELSLQWLVSWFSWPEEIFWFSVVIIVVSLVPPATDWPAPVWLLSNTPTNWYFYKKNLSRRY